jgi:hypothetical protein
VAAERAEYKPITNGQESASLYVYDSGVLHKLLGARGAAAISLTLGQLPKISYAFVALDGGETASTPAGVSFADFELPEVVKDQSTGDLTLGATYTATPGAPALVGGTTYPSMGIEIDTGVRAEFIDLLGSQTVEITDRQVKGKIKLDATAAQEIAFYTSIRAGTVQSVGLIHGSVVGRRFGVFGPRGQINMPSLDEIKGKRLIGLDLVFPPDAGNDELTLVTSF